MNYYLSPFINIYQPAKTNASGKEEAVPKALSALPVAGIFGIYNNLQQINNSHIYFCQFLKSGFHAFVIIGPTQVSLTFTVKQLAVARLVLQQHDQRTIVTPMKCAASELHML